MDHRELRSEGWAGLGGLSLGAIGLQTIMKAVGVCRMAGENERGGEEKARCRGSGGSASPQTGRSPRRLPPSPQRTTCGRRRAGCVRRGLPRVGQTLKQDVSRF